MQPFKFLQVALAGSGLLIKWRSASLFLDPTLLYSTLLADTWNDNHGNKAVVYLELALIRLTANCSLACYHLACEDQTGSGIDICGTTGKQELVNMAAAGHSGSHR